MHKDHKAEPGKTRPVVTATVCPTCGSGKTAAIQNLRVYLVRTCCQKRIEKVKKVLEKWEERRR